ncbi:uncharacterized protein LOC126481294 isoform X1 [Schistocerca serialis cubense]|uniref:uncharacterized protein LOC126481294 isoform X1 n=1 Tax=Schistocerca serialis cubense TaxID=2023355 RepID=UPI00214E5A79|nr:uncharacterized protein LOC126481294 isoform X1 [Schistocerca serialis cubense]XP_049960896.1 uncharacterized protein LOC126481294 isoform X1 [Schistocerca serialis cubense]
MDHSDIKLVEKLRREYPEQFYTLVRMHLSFILDLNTDESEVAHEKNKFKPSKWVSVAFSRKAKCPSKGVMEGAPLTQEGICQVYQLIEFLGKEQNIIQEGIFRRSGKMTRQNELKMLMNQGVPLKLGEGNFSVHDCASVLKNFLAELPEPLLTDAHFPAYYQISDLCKEVASGRGNEKRLLRALQLLLLLLPVENRLLLRDLLQLLHKTACHEAKNKMSADNLATLFTPHLICPRKLTPEALHDNSQKMCGVIAFMIKQEKNLFNIPPKLATDVRAFWIEHNKSRITPKVCRVSTDGLTASTVFSFVDRERSAEVHKQVGDPTEVALAQLYAHIQTLPESQQKRRLVKQFNRENGHGTPLRFKPHGRSRSLGDSIKRHIFKGGTKMDKCEDSLGRRCSVVRSLSQEDISTPTRTGDRIKLFQEHGSGGFTPLCEFPTLRKSLCDSNSTVVRLRYSRKTAKPLLLRRRLICVDSENSMCEENSVMLKSLRHNNCDSSSGSHSSKWDGLHKNSVSNKSQMNIAFSSVQCQQSTVDTHNELLVNDYCDRHLINGNIPLTVRNMKLIGVPESLSNGRLFHAKSVTFEAEGDHSNSPAFHVNLHSAYPVAAPLHNSSDRNCSVWLSELDTERTQALQRDQSPSVLPSTPIWAASTPALQVISLNQSSSISPITRSTQKMPKAMQETMMTPRSRKPVVVLSGSNLCHLTSINNMDTPDDANRMPSPIGGSRAIKAFVNGDCVGTEIHTPIKPAGAFCTISDCDKENSFSRKIVLENENSIFNMYTDGHEADSCNGGSLSSPFKSYLSSRSVLTASPIDLSFISRGSDLDSSVEEHRILQSVENNLSESLLFCLNGGQPSSLDDDSVENSRFAADKLCAVQVATSVPVKDVGTESSTFCKNFLQETSL